MCNKQDGPGQCQCSSLNIAAHALRNIAICFATEHAWLSTVEHEERLSSVAASGTCAAE